MRADFLMVRALAGLDEMTAHPESAGSNFANLVKFKTSSKHYETGNSVNSANLVNDVSNFRDSLHDFTALGMKIKTDHENTKTRKREMTNEMRADFLMVRVLAGLEEVTAHPQSDGSNFANLVNFKTSSKHYETRNSVNSANLVNDISNFRDPLHDFRFQGMKMKTDHENTKARKR